jgi:hypothetical protein
MLISSNLGAFFKASASIEAMKFGTHSLEGFLYMLIFFF